MATTLNLDQLTDRTRLKIDGGAYELRTRAEMAPLTLHRLQRKGKRLNTLMTTEDLNESEEQELAQIPSDILSEVLIAPPAVIEKLDGHQRWTICQLFLTGVIPTIPTAPMDTPETPTPSPTGA